MILSLFIIGAVLTIGALLSRLHEAREQLKQARYERDMYAYVLSAVRAVEHQREPTE
jgi:hypothetical protein